MRSKFTYKETTLSEIRKNDVLKSSLRKLTVCVYSSAMRHMLNSREESQVIICYLDTRPVGWIITSTHYTMNQTHPIALFVEPEFRRMGIGTKLLNRYSKVTEQPKLVAVCGDEVSHFFFSRVKKKWKANVKFDIFYQSESLKKLKSLKEK